MIRFIPTCYRGTGDLEPHSICNSEAAKKKWKSRCTFQNIINCGFSRGVLEKCKWFTMIYFWLGHVKKAVGQFWSLYFSTKLAPTPHHPHRLIIKYVLHKDFPLILELLSGILSVEVKLRKWPSSLLPSIRKSHPLTDRFFQHCLRPKHRGCVSISSET